MHDLTNLTKSVRNFDHRFSHMIRASIFETFPLYSLSLSLTLTFVNLEREGWHAHASSSAHHETDPIHRLSYAAKNYRLRTELMRVCFSLFQLLWLNLCPTIIALACGGL